MTDSKLHRSELQAASGEKIRLVYDEGEDMPGIFLGENEPATGVELTDHILMRLNQNTGRAVSLTIRHFSILAERTEYGPRSFPLDNLDELPENLKDLVIRLVTTAPVNQFLKLSHFQESPTRRVPLTFVEPYHFASAA
ncbi:MAG: DUF2283 domain-containing protein [candidate division KSB1 bacterium]|nr:DUF2283 domain-containing protein [candidate division KSB1 bacterium]MDZ7303772.1 DUF2283 domain-containing protein [candidate division KSB1 bacterium]MDZ7313031.1 DUF2283 domain-containing protein [candidate division KSB1 bacterium]